MSARPSAAERRGVQDAVRRGELVQPLRGVFVGRDVELTTERRAQAVALVLPAGAAIARRTAAWLFGVDARAPGEHTVPVPMECVVPSGTEPLSRRGLHCYATPLTSGDVQEVGGVPVTTPLRTAVDLLRWLPPHLGLGAADALAHRGLLSVSQLVTEVERFSGGRGIAQARRLAEIVEPLTESFGESWLRLRLHDAGFPRPRAQISLRDSRGREVYRLDLGWPERRLAVEYDGLEFHGSPEQQDRDRWRRAAIATAFGWTAIGVSMAEVLGRSMTLENGVGELLGITPEVARRRW